MVSFLVTRMDGKMFICSGKRRLVAYAGAVLESSGIEMDRCWFLAKAFGQFVDLPVAAWSGVPVQVHFSLQHSQQEFKVFSLKWIC